MKTILSITLGLALATPILALADWNDSSGGIMGYGGGMGSFGFFMMTGGIIWTIVGILATVWLWQQINKK